MSESYRKPAQVSDEARVVLALAAKALVEQGADRSAALTSQRHSAVILERISENS
ncbi:MULTISPECIES: hypothetical protein [Amycolatopsis]|uniref:Uncharacterized protein n=1 Tax=Amycolatopsis dendrobii TaxID=2760662 RepID=A0A7W3W3X4_9PSEU|nr:MULTISPECIES: hypothetical protein [Amycolatopsis]MBB1158298.1 hypothetical protein [Amycolatopsis dendrobii]UKD56800.1 hypothetical protein L3Q65_08790 [Amycolatopsis sp. FU40]